jgi:hypothetical protein
MFTNMRVTLIIGIVVFTAGMFTAAGRPLAAQERVDNNDSTADDGRDASWYYPQPTYRPNPQAIIHEKAQTRAAQRQARLASLSWYGMSNLRPKCPAGGPSRGTTGIGRCTRFTSAKRLARARSRPILGSFPVARLLLPCRARLTAACRLVELYLSPQAINI